MALYPATRRADVEGTYVYGMIDVPGVVASNNFLAIFNPLTSTVVHAAVEIGLTCYSLAQVQTGASLAAYRITAASAGTLVSASSVNKFHSVSPAPQTQVRIANPTVTRLNNTPLAFKAPVVAGTGGGNSGTVEVTAPASNTFILVPGEGLVFNTASGDTDELWNIVYSWVETPLGGD